MGRDITLESSALQPFAENTALETVTVGDLATYIGQGAFSGCIGLTSITIGNWVTEIQNSAFSGCKGLTSVTIGSRVQSISNNAFADCTGLPALNIPNSVTSIGSGAFVGCSNLRTVRLEDGSLSLKFLGEGRVGVAAFKSSRITGLYLGRDITLESSASQPFAENTALETLTIGKDVTSIGQYAFYNCTGLTSVTNNATTPQSINANVFGGVDVGKIPLTVPAASLALYKAAAVWRDFFSINGQATAIETPEADKFAIFPNPAKDEIFIRSEQPIEKVEIHDIAGKKIINCPLSIINSIDVSRLPQGVYFVKIFVGNQIFTKKIIKE